MGWIDSPTAIQALRALLFDGPADKYCSNKKVLGTIDGINGIFKTFEYRRVNNFTTAIFPQGVFKNGIQVPLVNITSDDLPSGTFVLNGSAIPTQTGRDVITASYYYQWFVDPELDTFLQHASTWLGLGTTYINIDNGLNASALRFAAQEAYEAAAMKYSVRASETYKLEDAPSEDILKAISAFKDMADSFMEKAKELRDDFYTRQGQSLSPLFNLSLGRVRDPSPRR